jgi:hypothetical protein
MAGDQFAFVSFLTQTNLGTRAGDTLLQVSVLNPGFNVTGGSGGVTNVYNSTVYNSTVVSNQTYRSNAMSLLGVIVQSATPASGVQYSEWVAGSTGYWMWIKVP